MVSKQSLIFGLSLNRYFLNVSQILERGLLVQSFMRRIRVAPRTGYKSVIKAFRKFDPSFLFELKKKVSTAVVSEISGGGKLSGERKG